ncbi:MAG TPA: HEAT repeat domain-containing protein [Gemmatimonadales bacterium]|nr:HEAT repeat domain-containing protein [Gemmatimonadales bacterium]
MNRPLRIALSGATLLAFPSVAAAQTLDRRVAAAGDGSTEFHFAAHEGVCGDGKSFMRAAEDGYYSSYNSNSGSDDVCLKGPVRVVIVHAGRDVVKIETYAGPLASDEGGHDLGAVSAREAASYLLGLATTLDGRPAREAILPATLADSAIITPQLLTLAQDANRSRDLRRTAISWLARRRNETGGVGAAAVSRLLDELIRNRSESESVRQQALSTVAGLDRGEGVPVLIGLVGDADTWLAHQATTSLANSGDPRARQFTREAVRRTDLDEDSRVAVINGLGNTYAGADDIKVLRDLYPSLNTDRERDAVLNAVASAGGNDNASWLLAIAKSPTEPAQRRRRVVSLLGRFDDPRVKDALKEMIDKE